jgi:hypothetical protein
LLLGLQSVRGTAPDMQGRGIGSLVLGLGTLECGYAALQWSVGSRLQAGISVLGGLALITAGILALVGRADYKTWRKAQRALKRRRRWFGF